MLGCFILFAAGGFIVSENKSLFFIPLLAFAGFAGAILFLQFGIRCPQCRNPIGQLTMLSKGGYFRISKNVGFCPYCGISLDAEMGPDGRSVLPTHRPGNAPSARR
jgi:hypothetical protein